MDNPVAPVVALVVFVGAVIVRWTARALAGEPRRRRCLAWLAATLASVLLLVLAPDLRLLAAGWISTSLCLHQLLLFFPERPQARIAAHKKFLVSRLADLSLLAALGLIWRSTGSFQIAPLLALARLPAPLPDAVQWACALLAATAILKSAQLPFHGWLIQVMEAPTPISALLHAGVVNIGGFVMIRLGALIARAPLAQGLLVGFGAATALVAALVMTTRISVKVMLAWSTCAQLGFMLVECGLGLYRLALLHLLAHSLYKAHAFLGAGGAVHQQRLRAMAPPPPRATLPRALAALLLVAIAHEGSRWLLGEPGPSAPLPLQAWALTCFVLLCAASSAIALSPDGRFARALRPHAFAGLHLDELFSALAFRLWPPPEPDGAASARGRGALP